MVYNGRYKNIIVVHLKVFFLIPVALSLTPLDLLDGLDFLGFNHLVEVLRRKDATHEYRHYPFEPDSTENLDIVLSQFCQCEVYDLDAMRAEEKVEEKVLDGL